MNSHSSFLQMPEFEYANTHYSSPLKGYIRFISISYYLYALLPKNPSFIILIYIDIYQRSLQRKKITNTYQTPIRLLHHFLRVLIIPLYLTLLLY